MRSPVFFLLFLSFLSTFPFFHCTPSPNSGDAADHERPSLAHTPLINPQAWTLTPETSDPHRQRRPDAVLCPPEEGYRFEIFNEEPSFQVHTGQCNYLTVQQPLLQPLYKGDQIHLRLWYFSLSSFDATEAFVSIRIGNHTLWSKTLPLPARSNLEFPTLPLEHDHPSQTTVFFHVDNHGANTWHLLELSASRP